MRGKEFLALGRELLPGTLPRHWRGATIHVYYALLLECRDCLDRWGFGSPARQQVHAQVRLRLIYAADQDLKDIGFALEDLNQRRNAASYDLRDLPMFASSTRAVALALRCENALAMLDAIDADPVRRATAIASITP
jgi:hypothetical protein